MAFSNTCTTTAPAPSSTASVTGTQAPEAPALTPQRLRPEERLCSQLIALIEQGVNPWRKPWNPSRCGQHRNLLTAKPYSGSNPALLELQLALRPSDLPLWIGFHQAAAMGWHPRKGRQSDTKVPAQKNGYCNDARAPKPTAAGKSQHQ